MDALRKHHLQVVQPEEAIVCQICASALSNNPALILSHISISHASPSFTNGSQLRDTLTRYNFAAPSALKPRIDHSPAVQCLRIWSGFLCSHCTFRTTSTQLLARHLSAQHQRTWKEIQPEKDFSKVHLQRWVTKGPGVGLYWVVQTPGPRVTHSPPRPKHPRNDHYDIAKVYARQNKRRILKQKRNRHDDVTEIPSLLRTVLAAEESHHSTTQLSKGTFADDAVSGSQWLDRTQWVTTYPSRDWQTLRDLVRLPSLKKHPDPSLNISYARCDEAKLVWVTTAIDAMFDRCEDTVRTTSRPTLCWLRSGHQSQTFPKPFTLVSQKSTTRRYRMKWKQCVMALLRAHRFSNSGVQLGVEIPTTSLQQQIIQTIWTVLDAEYSSQSPAQSPIVVTRRDEQSDDEDDDVREIYVDDDDGSSTGDTTSVSDDGESPTSVSHEHSSFDGNNALVALVSQLSEQLVREEFGNSRPSTCALIFLSGIFGIRSDCSAFHLARNYTGHISGFIYSCRLIFLEATYSKRVRDDSNVSSQSNGTYLEAFHTQRRRYMCFGTETPYAELSSLLAYGRQILNSEGPAFFVNWSDDGQTVSFNNHELRLFEFRAFADHITNRIAEMSEAILQGWNPMINLAHLRDHFMDSSVGYSFRLEPKNRLSTAYLDLLSRLCTSDRNPLMKESEWDAGAVAKLFSMHDSLLQAFQILFYIGSGQAPRAPELHAITIENKADRRRSIYLYRGRLLYLTQHHKARISTGNEFFVARYIPTRATQDLANYLVLIRPMVDAIRRHASHQKYCSPLFFSYTSAPDTVWSAPDLSSALSKLSRPFMSCPLNIQLCRQLTIAMTEKHIKGLTNIGTNRDRGADLDPESIFAWQSGHRPLQRATNYGIDGAFPHRLQPSLLRAYEEASDRWHDFLGWQKITQADPYIATPPLSRAQSLPQQSFGCTLWDVRYPRTQLSGNTPNMKAISSTPHHVTDSSPGLTSSQQEAPAQADSSPLAAEVVEDILHYSPAIDAIVCTLCGFVINSDHINEHLRRQPIHRLRGHEHRLQAFQEFLSQYPRCAQRKVAAERPTSVIAPVHGLPIHYPVLMCNICRHTRTTSKDMRAHVRGVHKARLEGDDVRRVGFPKALKPTDSQH